MRTVVVMTPTGPARSRHVLLYGPPAAGKLTVARCLSEHHGFRLVDNHVTVDAALRLFDFGTPEFGALVERLRVAIVEAAAEAGLDLVTTLVYARGVDDRHVARILAASERRGAAVTLVRLCPSTEALEERVGAASRLDTSKIADVTMLRRLLADYDLRAAVGPADLSIDNTALAPEHVAALIAGHVDTGAAQPPSGSSGGSASGRTDERGGTGPERRDQGH